MREHVEKMWCGSCGCKNYSVYRDLKTGDIITECQNCFCATVISFRVETKLEWENDNQGGVMTSNRKYKG